MKDYTKLIKALRKCGKASPDRCGDCGYYDREPWCEAALVNDAADALEAAEKRIAELQAVLEHKESELERADRGWKKQFEIICKLQTQIPKRGEWEITDNRWGVGKYRCSVCGRYEERKRPYCPNCGAIMRGANDAVD